MAKVSFKTKGGKRVSFTTKPGKSGGKKKLTAYTRHVREVIKDRPAGRSVQSAMRSAAKSWAEKQRKKAKSRR